jgi:anti-sigma-K factor RskA
MTDQSDELRALTGAYALDAVDDAERALVDAALVGSEDLRAEIDSFSETALVLAYASAPVEPVPSLKASIMASIQTMPQLPPIEAPQTAEQAPDASVASVAAPGSGLEARPASGVHRATTGGAEATARKRWFQRPGALLAAAAAVVIVAGGGFFGGHLVGGSTQQTGQTQASSAQLDKIYAASDFQRSSTPVTGGGTATVVWSDSLAKSAVILKDVKSVSSSKTYELWYIGKTITPAGTFNTASSGVTTQLLTGTKTKGDTVGITVEPAGGSKQPTTKPIVAVPTTTSSASSAERASASDPPQAAGAPTVPTSTASPGSSGDTSATSSDVASGVSGGSAESGSEATATATTPVAGASVSAGSSGVGVTATTPVGVGADASVGSSGVGATVTTPLTTGVDANVSGDGATVGVQTPLGTVGVSIPGLGNLLGQ